ncbi:MAG: hypothetical protein Q9192_002918 [Flavoplaca navasiana]
MSVIRRSLDLNSSPGVAQLVVAIVFGVLATLSVVLRFVSRRISRVYLSINDYAIVIALAATLSLVLATVISVAAGGAGMSKHQLSDVTAWMIQQILASLVLCRPISINWDASVNGTCGNVAANCLAGAGINTLTDILILILPMPIIWRLHVPLRNKLILSLIFGLGSLICMISIIRLKALLSYTTAPMMLPPFNSDGPRTNSMSILYTVLESCLGVICACLIIMKPIFTNSKFFNSLSRKISSWGSSSSNGFGAAKGRIPSWEHGRPQQHPGAQDLRIMKTCEIDVELDAAIVAQERRGQRLDHTHILMDMRREGGLLVDERSASESTISTSLKGGRSEAEVRRGV